jgi:glycosyltransferase involved in cell wall biosynthesis
MSILPKSNVVTTPTLCLNMIVKNEGTVITRLFESVLPYIDSYCICDTGSTDNTIEIIETFSGNETFRVKSSKNHFAISDIIAQSH